MLAPQALIRGLVSRILPPINPDSQNIDVSQRFSRYGEGAVLSYVRKSHLLPDEGSYFVTNNAQTGLATALLGTAFSQTTLSPTLIITNTDIVGGKRIYLDYVTLATTAAGAAASGLTFIAAAITTDTSASRYSSGGSDLTANIIVPNSDIVTAKSIAVVKFGTLTLNAATAGAKTVVGQRTLRPTASGAAADVIGETKILNFGGVEGGMFATYATLTAINSSVQSLPPLVIGPQSCAIIHLWSPGAALTTGISYAPEMGWWER
jgi:hypothetical protein